MTKVAPILFSILSILASCDSVIVAANPATTTTTTASTQPAKTFSIGLDLIPAGSAAYTASPAPATVHFSDLNLLEHPTDWLTEHDSWSFGDSSDPATPDPTVTNPRTGQLVHLNTQLTGPVVATIFENPGTYTVTLTRTFNTGQSSTCTAKVIVPPSKRTVFYIAPDGNDANTGTNENHPLQTATAAIGHLADHTEFRFRRGSVYKLQPEFPMKHRDILIDCYGEPCLPLPILQRNPPANIPPQDAMIFTTWPGLTADITIRHLRIDSPWTPAQTVDHYAYHQPAASFGILRGTNIMISDCEFENIEEGPHGDTTANGLMLLRNKQIDPLGIPSRTLWLEGHNVIAIGNIATNSVNESPLRAASTGIVNGLIAFNEIAQQLDSTHNRATAKAAVTLRTMQDVMITSNKITNSEFSFDPHSADAQDQRIVVENNAVINSMIEIKANVRHAIFQNNTIQRDGDPCFTIDPGNGDNSEYIEDLQMINNTGQGWLSNGRMMQLNSHTPQQLRGFVYDAMKNPYEMLTKAPATTH